MRNNNATTSLNSAHREPIAPATVGFRLDERCRRVLGERAARLGVSAHDLARHYLIECLEEAEERSAVRESIVQLRRELLETRKDIAISVEAILASAGSVSATDARK